MLKSKTAVANSGTEVVRMAETEATRSRRPPSRMPAITPTVRPMAEAKNSARPPRMPVLPSRGHSTSETGALKRTDSRSEEHTSELQSLLRISYAVFCLKKKKQTDTT